MTQTDETRDADTKSPKPANGKKRSESARASSAARFDGRNESSQPRVRGSGIDPGNKVCVVVASYTHMARAKACFAPAGYWHLIMRESSWERPARLGPGRSTSWRSRYCLSGGLIYEGAAWLECWIRGFV